MGTVNFNFRSQALGHYVDVTIIYPTDEYSWYDESTDGSRQMMPGLSVRPVYREGMKFQTVYLLHGGGAGTEGVHQGLKALRDERPRKLDGPFHLAGIGDGHDSGQYGHGDPRLGI